jgi:hypothetical protein
VIDVSNGAGSEPIERGPRPHCIVGRLVA